MRGYIFLLKNARLWSSWNKTTPLETSDALVSRINVFVKSDKASIDMSVFFFFNYVNVRLASILQANLIEHKKSVSGATKVV